ncbi:NAD(P)-dependent oxidoreductase [Algoriphagus zhangzhouensis]|uniref:D-3-phosphoglycerate dehydrogenase n=1 Tax=Algoriphagus zhangzhouensis TaxID=1073327 RepID=A0A1M7ZHU0_9BACT|nr:NAD(P)-dependent oxidoreductase [Algoriphagus zhangzhouensis]TDY44256.1 D-3-phosphoglycerate dehydrogenase [Algoriphagus zhangzhouensis]SHO64458.1 D-3-phosphoglycerate dehydrogenase [Algoriphagus zhangzhouensis]
MNIHLLESDRFSDVGYQVLAGLGPVSKGMDLISLKKADVLFVRLAHKIDSDFIKTNCPNVKYVLSPTTGHDHLDLNFFKENGIQLISLFGETEFLDSIPSTAEHTWALLLGLIRKLPSASSHAISEKWNRDLFIGNTLRGKTIGLLGYGRVGRQVANFALAFGMKVKAFDLESKYYPAEIVGHDNFEAFAESLDILSIHIPMNAKNRLWLNGDRLEMLKSGVKIINTSRGGIWDEEYLATLIKNGHVSGVATDVLADETNPEILPDNPLMKLARLEYSVLITPHIAGACFETMHSTEEFVVQKLVDTLKLG